MFPGSFIWNQINDEWLTSRTASRLFAASSVIILIGTPIWFGYVEVPDTTFGKTSFWGLRSCWRVEHLLPVGGCGDIGCIVTHPHERLRGLFLCSPLRHLVWSHFVLCLVYLPRERKRAIERHAREVRRRPSGISFHCGESREGRAITLL